MKKTTLLNQPLSNVIAGMGHKDTLAIADAGLPIPDNLRIDLAVSDSVPPFLAVLRAALAELEVEGAVIAAEIEENSPAMYESLKDLLGTTPIEIVPHETFKKRTAECKAVVRTGEFTPYANVILIAGVVF